MITDMVGVLKKEQVADDEKKANCEKELDEAEDIAKELARQSKDIQTTIADTKGSIAQATAQRKEEHAEFSETIAANNAAVDLIDMAKERLNKFYNPSLIQKSGKGSFAQKAPKPREHHVSFKLS